MSFAASLALKSVVRSGLVLELDPMNAFSLNSGNNRYQDTSSQSYYQTYGGYQGSINDSTGMPIGGTSFTNCFKSTTIDGRSLRSYVELNVGSSNGNFINLFNSTSLPSGNAARTLAAWCYVPSVVNSQWIWSYGTNTTKQALFYGALNGRYYIGTWGGDFQSTTAFPTNTWIYTVLTVSALGANVINQNTITLYTFDSALKTMSSVVSLTLADMNTVHYNTFLGNQVGGGQPMSGRIGYASAYNRVLSIAEMNQNFQAHRWIYGV